MVVRVAEAEWLGDLTSGQGRIKLGSGAFAGSCSYPSWFESAEGTNPEELLGAAEAGCFSMALSLGLTRIGHPPKSIHTTARVHLGRFVNGFAIDQIELETVAEVPAWIPESSANKLRLRNTAARSPKPSPGPRSGSSDPERRRAIARRSGGAAGN
jgi:lipoyl-dependent peroxiredoxin